MKRSLKLQLEVEAIQVSTQVRRMCTTLSRTCISIRDSPGETVRVTPGERSNGVIHPEKATCLEHRTSWVHLWGEYGSRAHSMKKLETSAAYTTKSPASEGHSLGVGYGLYNHVSARAALASIF